MSTPTDADEAVASDKTAKSSIDTSSAILRPQRSPAAPSATAPRRPPNKPIAKTGPNCAAGTRHADAISGATKAIDCVSKPSIIATAQQVATMRMR